MKARKMMLVGVAVLATIILLPLGVGAATSSDAMLGLTDALDTVVELYLAYLESLP